ncbi:twin-arginine translocase subunit TatC [Dysgonomonas sp. 25]|uniref:twin-arginine translocase subunit TatC n=1 Tax=Dysgonomonas sp. 25 TaxID=2302933 RepID=UPI0013D2CB03|nr:twin-arginine translocase subunit TatC [Dysgonomonas sp. 25]NDV68362.1 twin-arginine translocase subunit TatC [Dysgonomonas sp. 25]
MEENKGMTFWDHLEEFRWTLLRSLVALFIFGVLCFIAMPYIYDSIIMAPTNSNFYLYKYLCKATSAVPFLPDFCDDSFHVDIININMTSQFFRHITTSLWLALILSFPYLIFEIWKFVRPALYESEKKSFKWAFTFGTLMFFIGCIVGYSLVFPMTFRFLATYQLSEMIVNQISLDSYMDNFLMLIFMMGVVFELPLISWVLSQLGLLYKSFFKRYRRHAIVGLLVLSAFITPSGDPFTLSVVFVPLYFLYELSAFFVKPDPLPDEDENEELEEGEHPELQAE